MSLLHRWIRRKGIPPIPSFSKTCTQSNFLSPLATQQHYTITTGSSSFYNHSRLSSSQYDLYRHPSDSLDDTRMKSRELHRSNSPIADLAVLDLNLFLPPSSISHSWNSQSYSHWLMSKIQKGLFLFSFLVL